MFFLKKIGSNLISNASTTKKKMIKAPCKLPWLITIEKAKAQADLINNSGPHLSSHAQTNFLNSSCIKHNFLNKSIFQILNYQFYQNTFFQNPSRKECSLLNMTSNHLPQVNLSLIFFSMRKIFYHLWKFLLFSKCHKNKKILKNQFTGVFYNF